MLNADLLKSFLVLHCFSFCSTMVIFSFCSAAYRNWLFVFIQRKRSDLRIEQHHTVLIIEILIAPQKHVIEEIQNLIKNTEEREKDKTMEANTAKDPEIKPRNRPSLHDRSRFWNKSRSAKERKQTQKDKKKRVLNAENRGVCLGS